MNYQLGVNCLFKDTTGPTGIKIWDDRSDLEIQHEALKKDLEWLTSKILEVMYAYSDETISRVNEIKENLK